MYEQQGVCWGSVALRGPSTWLGFSVWGYTQRLQASQNTTTKRSPRKQSRPLQGPTTIMTYTTMTYMYTK